MIANWALIMVTIHLGVPIWELEDILPTRRACFAALERVQLAHDRLPHKEGIERFYRCDAPTGEPKQ